MAKQDSSKKVDPVVTAAQAELETARKHLAELEAEKAKQTDLSGAIRASKSRVNTLESTIAKLTGVKREKKARVPREEIQRRMREALGDESLSVAEIAKRSGLSVGQVRTESKRDDSPFYRTEKGIAASTELSEVA